MILGMVLSGVLLLLSWFFGFGAWDDDPYRHRSGFREFFISNLKFLLIPGSPFIILSLFMSHVNRNILLGTVFVFFLISVLADFLRLLEAKKEYEKECRKYSYTSISWDDFWRHQYSKGKSSDEQGRRHMNWLESDDRQKRRDKEIAERIASGNYGFDRDKKSN